MDRQQAIKILKNTGYIGNEIGVAFDVAIKSMNKLEDIEQIVKDYGLSETDLTNNDLSDFEKEILREILEKE